MSVFLYMAGLSLTDALPQEAVIIPAVFTPIHQTLTITSVHVLCSPVVIFTQYISSLAFIFIYNCMLACMPFVCLCGCKASC